MSNTPRGERNGSVKDPDSTVREARRLHQEEHLSFNKIAQRLSTPARVIPKATIVTWISGLNRATA